MDGKWKGVNKPSGTHYYTPPSFKHLTDCPGCKYGTLMTDADNTTTCIDCGREYTPDEMLKLRSIPRAKGGDRNEEKHQKEGQQGLR